MRSFFNRASFINGIIAGVLICAVKIILYMTGNFQMTIDQGFMYGSFAIIVGAMVLGSRGDRRHIAPYTYWQAMLSCMIVIITSLFIAGLANPILYAMDKDLPEQMVSFMRSTTYARIEKAPESIRNAVTEELDKMKASDLTGIWPFLVNWLSKSIANGIMAFAVAAFLYRKKAKFDYSEEITDDKL